MADEIHDAKRLAELQALPLERKIQITQTRIIDWYQHYKGKVCVSFSGGKDSTVLVDLTRRIYPDVRAVFSNTGLEYPEIQRFVRSFENVDTITPPTRFNEVISTYGYPVISKEVAEAIYYARRIRSQVVQVERERERESRPRGVSGTNSTGSGKQTEWKRMEIGGGGEEQAYPDEHSAKPQDGYQRRDATSRGREWKDWRRGCL